MENRSWFMTYFSDEAVRGVFGKLRLWPMTTLTPRLILFQQLNCSGFRISNHPHKYGYSSPQNSCKNMDHNQMKFMQHNNKIKFNKIHNLSTKFSSYYCETPCICSAKYINRIEKPFLFVPAIKIRRLPIGEGEVVQ